MLSISVDPIKGKWFQKVVQCPTTKKVAKNVGAVKIPEEKSMSDRAGVFFLDIWTFDLSVMHTY